MFAGRTDELGFDTHNVLSGNDIGKAQANDLLVPVAEHGAKGQIAMHQMLFRVCGDHANAGMSENGTKQSMVIWKHAVFHPCLRSTLSCQQ